MKNNVCHWEIAAMDSTRLTSFYANLFGWKVEPIKGSNYTNMRSGGQEGNGIDGGIYHKSGREPAYVTFYAFVDDLQSYLDKAVSMGATSLMPPTAIPGGGGYIAMFADPEGNRIGLYADPAGPRPG